jgi:hypothetical protein
MTKGPLTTLLVDAYYFDYVDNIIGDQQLFLSSIYYSFWGCCLFPYKKNESFEWSYNI